jgi:hypothetical protein
VNLESEIQYFTELAYIDKARLLNLLLHELAEAARGSYGQAPEQVHDGLRLRFVNELVHRLTRLIEQLLAEDEARPADEVVMRMLLAPRADKTLEQLVYNAYGRAIRGFESYDTTVLTRS